MSNHNLQKRLALNEGRLQCVNIPTSVGTSHATLFSKNWLFEQNQNMFWTYILVGCWHFIIVQLCCRSSKGEAGRIQVFRHLPNLFLVSFHVDAIKMLGLKIRFTYGPYSSKILERQWIMVTLSENTHLTGLYATGVRISVFSLVKSF